MKYKAVIFDLFGTLVNKFPIDESIDILRQMAGVLGVSADDLVRLWFETFDKRHGGDFKGLEEDIRYVCRKLGASPEDGQVRLAAQINLDYVAKSIKPRPNAVEVLTSLREHGYKIGLISNWSDEVPTVWNDIPLSLFFDVALFSCRVGMMKPDRRIYRLAAEKLAVRPEKCLYIGDGDSSELAGAAAAGMRPVLIDDNSKSGEHPVNAESEDWKGDRISSLTEIINLFEKS